MATFKVKDLMIRLPEEGERPVAGFYPCYYYTVYAACQYSPRPCVSPTVIPCQSPTFYVPCQSPTILTPCPAMTGWERQCPGASVTDFIDFKTTTPVIVVDTMVETIKQTVVTKVYAEQGGDLELLLAQMNLAVESVEVAVRARDEALAPKTAEEIAKLEEKLQGALADLKERKGRLQK